MRTLLTLLVFVLFSNTIQAQVNFENLSKVEQQEILAYLADISKIAYTRGYVAITPDGRLWDNQNYKPPKVFDNSVKYDGTPKTEFLFRSMKLLPETSKMYVYNGNTLIVNGVVDVRLEIKGQPMKMKVGRLETHIKTNGKWQMASGSGTFVEPPTPADNK